MPAPDDDARGSRLAGLVGSPLTLARREATRMPLVAVTVALQAWERSRGVRTFALRRGNEVLQIVAHTPLGRFLPTPVHDDDADAEAVRIATAVRTGAGGPTRQAPRPAATPAAKATPATKATPAAGVPATAATASKAARPAKSAPSAEAVAAGAPGAVTDKVEKVTEQLDIDEPESRDELPIPDFDNVSLGSLRARLRSLSIEDLVRLREWEQAHANRLPVVTLLDNRIAKVSAETNGGTAYPKGSTPASGDQAASAAADAAKDEGGTLRI
jgi:hypothetical protein